MKFWFYVFIQLILITHCKQNSNLNSPEFSKKQVDDNPSDREKIALISNQDFDTTNSSIISREGNNLNFISIPIFVNLDGSEQAVCSGVLITNNIVLTAARCIKEMKDSTIQKVMIGYPLEGGNFPHTEIDVETVNLHPKYNHYTYEYNFAYLKLAHEIEEGLKNFGFSGHNLIEPAKLTTTKDLISKVNHENNQNIFTLGIQSFKKVLESSQSESTTSKLKIFDHLKCKELNIKGKLFENMFCVVSDQVCSDEIGSPLIRELNGAYTLLGIKSWHNDQCNNIAVFTLASKETLDWIRQNECKGTNPDSTEYLCTT